MVGLGGGVARDSVSESSSKDSWTRGEDGRPPTEGGDRVAMVYVVYPICGF